MSKLEELQPNAAVRGILPDSLVARERCPRAANRPSPLDGASDGRSESRRSPSLLPSPRCRDDRRTDVMSFSRTARRSCAGSDSAMTATPTEAFNARELAPRVESSLRIADRVYGRHRQTPRGRLDHPASCHPKDPRTSERQSQRRPSPSSPNVPSDLTRRHTSPQ